MKQRKLKTYNFLNVIPPAIDFSFYLSFMGFMSLKVGWRPGSSEKRLLLPRRTEVWFPGLTVACHSSLKLVQLPGTQCPLLDSRATVHTQTQINQSVLESDFWSELDRRLST